MHEEHGEGLINDVPAPSEQVLRPIETGLVNVDRLAESIARELDYTGSAFALEVVHIQDWIFGRARAGELRLFREDKPFPFILDGLYELHGGLRLSDAEAAKVEIHFLGSKPAMPKSERSDHSTAVAPSGDNWKMRVQAEAAARFLRLRAQGANPTVHSILDDLAKWCQEHGVRTTLGIHPSPGYLRNHVLSRKHWTPPS